MNFYASSVALLWTTAMRLGNTRAEVRETDAAERVAASPRPRAAAAGISGNAGVAVDAGVVSGSSRPGVGPPSAMRASEIHRLTCKCE
jgi:hypothetical protein